ETSTASKVSNVPKASETSEALKAPKTLKASKAEIWTDRLQRLAGRKHDRILRKFSVVTPGKRGEQAFNRLFPSASEDAVEERVDMFLLAEEMLSGEG
ncbi:MAG: hypothetical protein Q4D81_07335, partial [Eubacteriales bacterium]|nr:hypothetical protein [Eubacteriales bacterium]